MVAAPAARLIDADVTDRQEVLLRPGPLDVVVDDPICACRTAVR